MSRKYMNIQKGPDGASTVFIYGEIGDYGDAKSGTIVSELLAAEQSGGKVNIRINSIGGDVYSGIALFNALRGSRADIHIYVDGVAASIAAVVALCGKPVTMSRFARLMLHNVSGGCYGGKKELAQCIAEIEALEDTLSEMLSARLHTTKDEIKARYFDGNDHWLDAKEALELGLIDGIHDADPVPDGSTPEQIYSIFNNRLGGEPTNQDSMKLEEIKKRPRFKDCADEAAVMREIETLEVEAAKVAPLEARVREFETAAEAAAEAERTALLDAAENEGRINATTRPVFENILKRDMAEGKAALAALTPARMVMEAIATPPKGEGPFERRMRQIRENRNR